MHINITGIDGAGKTTQVNLLANHFQNKNTPVFISRAFDTESKEIFLPILEKFDPVAIMFFFQALFVEQRKKAIEQQSKGKIVISDRWDDAFLIYHANNGILRNKHKLRQELNFLAFKDKSPDLTILLDIDPHLAKTRMNERGQDFMDRQSISFFKQQRKSFRKMARELDWAIICGEGSCDYVFKCILETIDKFI